MAVKVIGAKPVRTKQVVCKGCGYQLEYSGEDVKHHVHTDYGGGSEDVYTVKCPRETCAAKTIVVKW